eukprot:Nk52_evm24s370 gene=Nk52_evmTU24s370
MPDTNTRPSLQSNWKENFKNVFKIRGHFSLMMWKNWLFMKRSYKTTFLQLAAPAFFIILIVILQSIPHTSTDVLDPPVEHIDTIPKCVNYNGINDCITLMYAPYYKLSPVPPGQEKDKDHGYTNLDMAEFEDCAQKMVKYIAAKNDLKIGVDVKPMPNFDIAVNYMGNRLNSTTLLLIFGEPSVPLNRWCFPGTKNPDPMQRPFLDYTIVYNGTRPSYIQYFSHNYGPYPDGRMHLQKYVEQGFLLMAEKDYTSQSPDEFVADVVDKPDFYKLTARNFPLIFEKSFKANVPEQLMTTTVFVYCGLMFHFLMLLYNITLEKEMNLRKGLRTVGLSDFNYWMSWYCTSIIMSTISVLSIIALGYVVDLLYFTHCSLMMNIALFISFSFSITALAFLLSVFLNTTRQALSIGMLMYILGILFITIAGNPLILDLLFDPRQTSQNIQQGFSIFSPFNLAHVMGSINEKISGVDNQDHAQVSSDPDTAYFVHWNELFHGRSFSNYDFASHEHYTVNLPPPSEGLNLILLNTLVYLILAWYLDNVWPNSHGIRKPWYFLVTPSYWKRVGSGWTKKYKNNQSKHSDDDDDDDDEPLLNLNEDSGPESEANLLDSNFTSNVEEEAQNALKIKNEQFLSVHNMVRSFQVPGSYKSVEDFQSAFDNEDMDSGDAHQRPGNRSSLCSKICRCWCRKGTKEFRAVNNLSFSCAKGKLLSALGHNGAGKSTLISMLTGTLVPSSGDAYVFGKSIVHEMDDIRPMIGLCAQFDILWNELTAREHIELYAMLKYFCPTENAISFSEIPSYCEGLLKKVHLDKVMNNPVATYSGGMKRRLSVAISLVGNPQIVFLDEPTTGMDPLIRRNIWDLILEHKKERLIVMTTHSIEEADILSDKVIIMAGGQLQAVGSPLSLKNKYAGYVLSVSIVDTSCSDGETPEEGQSTFSQVRKSSEVKLKNFVFSFVPGARYISTSAIEEGKLVEFNIPPAYVDSIQFLLDVLEKKKIGNSEAIEGKAVAQSSGSVASSVHNLVSRTSPMASEEQQQNCNQGVDVEPFPYKAIEQEEPSNAAAVYAMNESSIEGIVVEYSISQTTLEDVFLKITVDSGQFSTN